MSEQLLNAEGWFQCRKVKPIVKLRITYNIIFDGVKSIRPIFLEFDGTDWVDLDQIEASHDGPAYWHRWSW